MARLTTVTQKRRLQTGFTLIELMIAMVIGLIVTAAVISMFITTLTSSTGNLRMIRMNQDLRAVLSLMVQDIRRAGYLYGTTVAYPASGAPLPSTTWDGTTFDNPTNQIEFTYDYGNDGAYDNPGELYGYRRAIDGATGNGVIEMKTVSGTGTIWSSLTDPNEMNVTAFDINIVCENALDNSDSGKNPGDTACANVPGVYVRTVEITISAVHPNDSAITRTVTERVRIRNDQLVKPLV